MVMLCLAFQQLCYVWICFAAVLRKNDQKPFKQGIFIFSTTMTVVGHLYVMYFINNLFINYLTCLNVCFTPSQNTYLNKCPILFLSVQLLHVLLNVLLYIASYCMCVELKPCFNISYTTLQSLSLIMTCMNP